RPARAAPPRRPSSRARTRAPPASGAAPACAAPATTAPRALRAAAGGVPAGPRARPGPLIRLRQPFGLERRAHGGARRDAVEVGPQQRRLLEGGRVQPLQVAERVEGVAVGDGEARIEEVFALLERGRQDLVARVEPLSEERLGLSRDTRGFVVLPLIRDADEAPSRARAPAAGPRSPAPRWPGVGRRSNHHARFSAPSGRRAAAPAHRLHLARRKFVRYEG